MTRYYFWLGRNSDEIESLDAIREVANFHPPGFGEYQKEYTNDEERTRTD